MARYCFGSAKRFMYDTYIRDDTSKEDNNKNKRDRCYWGTGVYLAGYGEGEVIKNNHIRGRHNPYFIGKNKKISKSKIKMFKQKIFFQKKIFSQANVLDNPAVFY